MKSVTTEAYGLGEYLNAAVIFVVISVVVVIGTYIVSSVSTQIGVSAGTNSTAYNASLYAVTGMQTFASWLPILAIVVVAVVIIGLLSGFVSPRRAEAA